MSCCNSCNETIQIIGGMRQKLPFDLYNGRNGAPFLTNVYEAWFSMVPAFNREMSPVVSKKMKIELSATGAPTNMASVILQAQDTYGLSGKFIYQITIYSSSLGLADVPVQGEIIVHRNIDPDVLKNFNWGN